MISSKHLVFLLPIVFLTLLQSGCSNSNNSPTFKVSSTETTLVPSSEQGTFQFESHEGNINHSRVFKLEINKTLDQDASVSYATLPGTALAGEDYTNALGRAVIPAGELSTLIEVEIIADTVTEPDETFTLKLSDPQGGAFSSGTEEIRITQIILNEDIDPETLLSEVRAVLDDPSIPYTTKEEFEKTEYAQNQISDDKARRLEKAHSLVAVAEDPDPDWFMTEVDRPVTLAEKGMQYSVNLNKISLDQNIIGPVDNDKLRLIVRIQRSETDFEYVVDADVENYARWGGLGVLDVTVPNDLEQGRLMIGVRPNFDDEASNAIAERWSAAIVAEVWNTKPDTVTVNSSSVLFPIDDDAARGLAGNSQFTRSELTKAVQEQLDNNNSLVLPIVLQDANLQEGQLVSYIFKNSPYSGRVYSVQNRGNQQLVMLSPEFFNVYEITDANDGFMVDQGVLPENVIFRSGGPLLTEEDSEQLQRQYRESGLLSFFTDNCSDGLSVLTFKPSFSIYPIDAGLDFRFHSPLTKMKCKWEANEDLAYISAGRLFAVSGPAAIAFEFFGTGAKIQVYGNIVAKAELMKWNLETGYSFREGVNPLKLTTSLGFLDRRDLEANSAIGKAELSGTLGLRASLSAVSGNGILGKTLGFINVEVRDLGLQAGVNVKVAFKPKVFNAKEVHVSKESSELAASLDVGVEIRPTKSITKLLKGIGIRGIKVESVKIPRLEILPTIKSKANYTFSSWDDDGQGAAKITDLRLTENTHPFLSTVLAAGNSKGVLSGNVESIFNDKSENISYELQDCENNNHEISSKVIACSGLMCGTVDKEVKLCKSKVAVFSNGTLSGIVGESNTQASALRVENQGTEEVNYSLEWAPSGQPISQKITLSPVAATLGPRGIQSITATFSCTEAGELEGTIGVQRPGGEIENTAEVQLSCTECEGESCDDSNGNNSISANQGGDPHLTTFDRLGYSFQGVGEFILVKSLIENDTFEVQTRYRPWGNRTDASVAQAVAMRLDQDRVGFYRGMEPPLRVNGSATELPSGESLELPSGGSITRTNSTYRFSSADDSAVEVRDGLVDMFVGLTIPKSKEGQVMGLFGNANGDRQDDITIRGGTILGTQPSFDLLYPSYANSWRVSQGESLFDYATDETTETFTDRDFPSVQTTTSTLPEDIRENAEQICRTAGITNPVLLDNCILDVSLTGDTGFANILGNIVEPTEAIEVIPPATPMLGDFGFGQFAGSVSNAANGGPITSGKVTLTVDGNPMSGNHEHAIEDGQYETSVIPVGSAYLLDVHAEGFIAEKVYGLSAQDKLKSEVEAVALVPLSHSGIGTISGTIRSALNNSEVANLNVSLRRYVNRRTGSVIETTVTDQNGVFQFESLEAGNYTIAVQAEGYITTYFNAVNLGGQTNQADGVVSPELGASQFRVVLTWGNSPADLDAHLTGPGADEGERFHIYFSSAGNANLDVAPHAYLDQDEKYGIGPETITVGRLFTGGIYRFSVHDYSNKSSTSSQDLGGSGARVEVYGNGNQLLETFSVPNRSGNLWTVFEINELGTIVPVNQIGFVSSNTSTNGLLNRGATNNAVDLPKATDYWQVLIQKPKED